VVRSANFDRGQRALAYASHCGLERTVIGFLVMMLSHGYCTLKIEIRPVKFLFISITFVS